MSKKHISYPKIQQLRNIVSNVYSMATYVGKDENGDPIYDGTIPRPTLTFKGTVKLHGTNASVAFNASSDMWFQSRKHIITPIKDNAGFAFFAESNKEKLYEMIDSIIIENDINTSLYTTTIYGEWCGGNIQKGVGISKLPKMFVIFGVKISPIKQDIDGEASYWVDHTKLEDPDNKIYNINNFKTFEVDIDFTRTDKSVEKIIEMTLEVEKECPVAKALGVSGIGEGIVFTSEYKDTLLKFKSKGKAHSSSKVKTISPIDIEKMDSIHEFVDYSVTENRLNQAIEQVFTSTSTPIEIRMTGPFLKWVVNDILDEEMDVMVKSNLEPNDVKRYISTKAREWFQCYLDKQSGL